MEAPRGAWSFGHPEGRGRNGARQDVGVGESQRHKRQQAHPVSADMPVVVRIDYGARGASELDDLAFTQCDAAVHAASKLVVVRGDEGCET